MASKKKPNRPRPSPGPRRAPEQGAPKSPASKPPLIKPAAAGAALSKPGPSKPTSAKAGAPGARGLTRTERLAAAEKARRAKATRMRALIAGVLVAVVALLTVTIVASRRSADRTVAKLEASGSCKYDTKSDTDGGAGNNHVDGDVKYSVDPPAGGNHNPTAAAAGVYTAADAPPVGQLVHALEHGYVAIWYRPDLPANSLDDLKTLAGKYTRDVLLVPRASMKVPVAATAWHHRLLCSQPDLTSLELFVTTYRNKAPERIPH